MPYHVYCLLYTRNMWTEGGNPLKVLSIIFPCLYENLELRAIWRASANVQYVSIREIGVPSGVGLRTGDKNMNGLLTLFVVG